MELDDATSLSSHNEGTSFFDVLCSSSPVGCPTWAWTLVSLSLLYMSVLLVSVLLFLFFRLVARFSVFVLIGFSVSVIEINPDVHHRLPQSAITKIRIR